MESTTLISSSFSCFWLILISIAIGYYYYYLSSKQDLTQDLNLAQDQTSMLQYIQFVRLERTDDKNEPINILEIELYDQFGNKITTGITPIISPQYLGVDKFGPQFLIDGKATYSPWENNSGLPHTNATKDAYMELQLSLPQILSKIIIKNRLDCCKERIVGTSLILMTEDGTEVSRNQINEIQNEYEFQSTNGVWI